MSSETVDDDGTVIGYGCEEMVQKQTELLPIDLKFYFDLAFPEGHMEKGIDFVRTQIIESISTEYRIKSGISCGNPEESLGVSWLVKFTSSPLRYSHVQVFERCRNLEPVTDMECLVFEGGAKAWAIGVPDPSAGLPDVDSAIAKLLNDTSIYEGTPFLGTYLGKPIEDPSMQEGGRDNLSPPSSINEQQMVQKPQGRRTVTVIGGLLVTAFCIAFVGILIVLFRRRQRYLQSKDIQLALSKSHLNEFDEQGATSDEGGNKTLEQETTSEEYLDGLENAKSSDTESFPNNITFDLGNSFKDQLMGVHGRSAPRAMPPFGAMRPASDNQSDSDADSWAQTDGTIGSLELQLEPITAEV